jgi:hypothetical protein
VYHLEIAGSVAKPFLHANTPQYINPKVTLTELDVLLPACEEEKDNAEVIFFLLLLVVSHYTSATNVAELSSHVIQ